MSDTWIRDRIDLMREEGLVHPDLAAELEDALATGNFRKELVVVQNTRKSGATIVDSLNDPGLEFDHVDLVKIGRAVEG